MAFQWAIESAPTGSTASLAFTDLPFASFYPDLIGDYVLSFMVSDDTDWSVPDTLLVHIDPNLPPTAVIDSDITTGEAPLTVQFDGTGSSDPEGRSLDFVWSFDDFGEESTEPASSYTFNSAGNYNVQLVVWDDVDQYGVDYITITVSSLNISPDTHDFGDVELGSASSMTDLI